MLITLNQLGCELRNYTGKLIQFKALKENTGIHYKDYGLLILALPIIS